MGRNSSGIWFVHNVRFSSVNGSILHLFFCLTLWGRIFIPIELTFRNLAFWLLALDQLTGTRLRIEVIFWVSSRYDPFPSFFTWVDDFRLVVGRCMSVVNLTVIWWWLSRLWFSHCWYRWWDVIYWWVVGWGIVGFFVLLVFGFRARDLGTRCRRWERCLVLRDSFDRFGWRWVGWCCACWIRQVQWWVMVCFNPFNKIIYHGENQLHKL